MATEQKTIHVSENIHIKLTFIFISMLGPSDNSAANAGGVCSSEDRMEVVRTGWVKEN